jgi:type III secretion protein N (ATPase)
MTSSDSLVPDLADLTHLIAPDREGRVTEVTGTLVRASLPEARLGEQCRLERPGAAALELEVVGFDRGGALLMPLGPLQAVAAGARLRPIAAVPRVPAGDAVVGRVIDALGRPIDGMGALKSGPSAPLLRESPSPMTRERVSEPLQTGVRAIDGLLTMGVGQRIGLFAAAGGGKSTLLSMLARNVVADRVVVGLIGERGREVRDFVEDALGTEGLARSTVVVSTSDEPALLRIRAAYAATAIAEEARDRGEHVLLLMDSVTRFARAVRDVGLATGEPPGRQGFPPSVYAVLPRLFERAGRAGEGSITAIYTVLVAGDDLEEPIADETLSLLDGHVILSRRLAEQNQYPAIDILDSKSRLMDELVDDEHRSAAHRMRKALAVYRRNYDKIVMGRFEPDDDETALLAEQGQRVVAFLSQGKHDRPTAEETRAALLEWAEA